MPQLPSGRHAGIDPAPLFRLLKDAESGRFVHRLMAITDDSALFPYLEVIELLPAAENDGVSFSALSADRPCEFIKRCTGVMADKIDKFQGLWAPEDIEAMKQFLDEPRAVQTRRMLFEKALKVQEHIKTSGSYIARIQALWWLEGVHPAQEEGWTNEEEEIAEGIERLAGQHMASGCECERRADWPQAADEYRKALALNAADPRVRYFGHNNLAYCLLQLGQFAEASAHCQVAIDINGEQHNAYKNLGLAYEGLDRFEEAAISFISAARLAPGDKRAWLHLQKILEKHPDLPTQSLEVAEGAAAVRRLYEANGGEPRLN